MVEEGIKRIKKKDSLMNHNKEAGDENVLRSDGWKIYKEKVA